MIRHKQMIGSFLLAMMLVLSSFFQVAAAEQNSLVALGDAIVAGYGLSSVPGTSNEKKNEDNYVNKLAEELDMEPTNYGENEMTSAQLLELLESSKGDGPKVKASVKAASLITVSIGTYDLFEIVDKAVDEYTKENEDATLKEALNAILTSDAKRIEFSNDFTLAANNYIKTLPKIISTIKEYNPLADIVVNTIYNPFLGIDGCELISILYETNLDIMNKHIIDEAGSDYSVADVYDAFYKDGFKYTNMISKGDIYPNKMGYEIIFQTVLDVVPKLYPFSITDKDTSLKVSGYISQNPDDVEMKLSVTKLSDSDNKAVVESLKNIAKSCTAYEVGLTDEDGKNISFTGKLKLAVPFDSSFDKTKIAVYYFNSSNAKQLISSTISGTVANFEFSSLGKFVVAELLDDSSDSTSTTEYAFDMTDSSSGIKVKGKIKEDPDVNGLKFAVSKITDNATVSNSLKDVAEKYFAYDMTLTNTAGKAVTLVNNVSVTVPVPSEYDSSKLVVYYIDSNGVKTAISHTISGSNLTFETGHFSIYAIAQKFEKTTAQNTDSTPTAASSDEVPEVGDKSLNAETGTKVLTVGLGSVCGVLILIAGVIMIRRRPIRSR